MSDMQKKQNFLQGTALLAMATAIVKVIGALYKIPLNAIIGEQGFGYFNTAYDIYNVLLMISTAGLPVAMSRMISQASSLDHYNQVRRIYHTARGIFLALGIAGSLLMTVFCRQLAAFQNQPDAWAAIGCLGPCVLLICIMSTYRGFFQGQGNMLPTSVSQVLEAVVKLIVGMGAALAILKMTNEIPLAAGGAILGVTASCLVSAIYLFGRFRKSYALLPRTEEEPRSYRETARGLLAIAIPITFGSAALQLMTMLETKIYMGQLLNLGYTQSSADTMRGVYGMCLTIFNKPCAFITPITISIIPAITSHLTLCGDDEAKATEESAVRITGLIAMPCAFGLALLAEPITALLGGYSGGNLAMATRLMTVLGFTIIFNALVLVSTAIMQAHGQHADRRRCESGGGVRAGGNAAYQHSGYAYRPADGLCGHQYPEHPVHAPPAAEAAHDPAEPSAFLFRRGGDGRPCLGRAVGAESHRRAGDRNGPSDSVRRAGSGGRRQLLLHRRQVQSHHP